MLSVTLTVMVRCAGLVAVTTVVTVYPVGLAADFVHDRLISTGTVSAAFGSQVLPKLVVTGEAVFSNVQMWAEFLTAPIVLESCCGSISLTGIDTRFWPTPDEPRLSFHRFPCSDAPLKLDAPNASRM